MKRANFLTRIVDTLRPAATPVRPAVLRLGIGAYMLVNNVRRRKMVQRLHRQDASHFVPTGVVKVLKKPLPPAVADTLFDAAQVATALSTVGWAHRVTGPISSALQLWTLTYRNSWGMIFHSDNMALMHQIVVDNTRSADALSVDTMRAENVLMPQRYDRAYGGIPTAMNVATCAVYFLSGVAKVRSPQGWGWARGDTLREQIAADAIRKNEFGDYAPQLASTLYHQRAGFTAMGVATLVVELGAPLSLVNRRLGQLFSIAAWGMHTGIRVVMGIKFNYNTYGISYLPYFPIGSELPVNKR